MDQTQRPIFYEGQYLAAEDLEASVAYERFQLARHALGAHVWGIGIGLDLRERKLPGGDIEASILPGIAWDGYGRALVVAAPVKIPMDRFANFQADTPPEGLLVKVWLRYEEGEARAPAPGYEACIAGSQYARAIETYAIEVGDPPLGAHGPVNVAGFSIDARNARSQFLPGAKPLYDESVPYQAFPESGSKPRWWIPIGYVRWLKEAGQAGKLIARDDSGGTGQPPDSDLIRAFRQYIGVVAETLVAADGAIRLRHRRNDPTQAHFQPPLITTDPKKPAENDLVWVEGAMRVFGDGRLAGGNLEMREANGVRDGVPQVLRRRKNAEGGLDLQAGFAAKANAKGDNAFAIGVIDVDASSGELKELARQLVVRDSGNVGIAIDVPTQLLTLGGEGKTRLEVGRVGAAFPWSTNSAANAGGFAINQQSKGTDNPGADFALKRDGKLRVTLGNTDTLLSAQNGAVRVMVNHGEPGEAEAMRVDAAGNVGIGTAAPVARLEVAGDIALDKMNSGGPRPLPADATLIWNDGQWLRLNQNLDFSKPIFGVHTPGLFAPNSLNVGGAGGWVDPGAGNVAVKGTTTLSGALTVDGVTKITGATTVNGATTIHGATTIDGAATLTGATTIEGSATLEASTTVQGSLTVQQNLHVWGFKNFVMAHPTAKDRMLVHACVEGPEAAVYYRGEGRLEDGAATVKLPSYFEGLTRVEGRTVQVTALCDGDDENIVALAATPVRKGRFGVRAIGAGNPRQRFYWEVKATRADLPEFEAEPPMTEAMRASLHAARKARQ
jgi:hypothetical protein